MSKGLDCSGIEKKIIKIIKIHSRIPSIWTLSSEKLLFFLYKLHFKGKDNISVYKKIKTLLDN